MAEKPEDQTTIDEKISKAKEMVGRGTRNFYVSAYSDAAEDLSQACSIYSELYGPVADELGHPYLLYAKSLIAVAQDENKLMDIPEEENEDDDDDEEEEGGDGKDDEGDGDGNVADNKESESKTEEKEPVASTTNGHHGKSDVDAAVPSSSSGVTHPEPSSSTAHTNGVASEDKVDEATEEIGDQDLQVAWEVLELAVKIFERQGEPSIPHLAESYSELANISFENSFFDVAIKDYNKSFDLYTDLPEPNRRILAEIKYKIGLCYCMLNEFDQSVQSFKESCDLFDDEINAEKERENISEEEKDKVVKDLEETKQEIVNKMIEVEESKLQSAEEVKNELAKLLGQPTSTSDGAGSSGMGASSSSSSGVNAGGADTSGASSSSLSEANKPKPSDISHLIKRKKPETENNVEAGAPPAKKPSI